MTMKMPKNPNLRAIWALLLLGVAIAAMSGQIAYSEAQRNSQTMIEKVRNATDTATSTLH
jgi:hypothetical protein